jgi:DNA invertase Pin-like site-specific DNA recombinase
MTPYDITPAAEIELQHTCERQAAGIAAAKKKGVYKGRAKGTTEARLRRARELKGQGLSAPEQDHQYQ